MLSSIVPALKEKNNNLDLLHGVKEKSTVKPMKETKPVEECACPVIEARNFSFYYGSKMGIKDITMKIQPCAVTAIIGQADAVRVRS
jgi:ABC-type multidrug transport system fused ATPase/permease subunit